MHSEEEARQRARPVSSEAPKRETHMKKRIDQAAKLLYELNEVLAA